MTPRPVLPIADVRAEGDAFRCEPFGCVLSARACVARQRAARGRARHGVETRDVLPFATCGRCAEGAAMRRRVEGGR